MNTKKEQEIRRVIENHPELEQQLALAESPEDVQAAFAACGCQLSEQDISALLLMAAVGNGELQEDALDNVAGGRFKPLPYGGIDPRWPVLLWQRLKRLFK